MTRSIALIRSAEAESREAIGSPGSIGAFQQLRPNKLVATVLTVFGDESADETKERVFAVAGIFGSQEQWDALKEKWLVRTGGVIFHASDCECDQGDYAENGHEVNLALYRDLITLLADSNLLGYGVSIDIASQNQHLGELLPDAPYYKCFAEVVLHFAEQGFLAVPPEPVSFTFDFRLESKHNAAALYDHMSRLASWQYHSFIQDEIAFAVRKSVGIQVADLYARETMKFLDNQVGPVIRPKRRSLIKLEATGRFGMNAYTGEYFKGLKVAIEQNPSFRREEYAQWLEQHRILDNWASRVRYFEQSKER